MPGLQSTKFIVSVLDTLQIIAMYLSPPTRRLLVQQRGCRDNGTSKTSTAIMCSYIVDYVQSMKGLPRGACAKPSGGRGRR